MTKKTFKIVTLGCRTNQYETQAYSDQLKEMGYALAQEGEADLCIVNTCTVTESADSSSRHAIRQLKRENPNSKVVVTGCYAERKPDEVKAAGAELVVPNSQKESLIKMALPDEEAPEFKINLFDAHTRAFVKVQDGCNSFCTYCIIPYVRGRSRSRKREEIVAEVKGLIANGFKEIVLTGINIGDYDGGGGDNLANLVREVDSIDGLKRLRLSSIDPDEVNDDLMSAIIDGKNTCPSMHIVLQSGSNAVLKRMNRKYTRQIFMQTIDKLRLARPDFTFTTDIIVGFPGETDADFQETLDVMKETQFVAVHMFPYSKRPRTRAALYTDHIDHETIKLRKNEVLRLKELYAYKVREKYVGKTVSVLTENDNRGHTGNFLEVIFNKSVEPNTLIDVYLESNSPQGLIAL